MINKNFLPQAHIWRPFTQMKSPPCLFEVSKTKDSLITLKNGQEIIDAISSWWVITHGHCQTEISKAIAHQSNLIDQVLFAHFSHSPANKLVENLKSLLPQSLNHFFFSDNGSTAVESALKMVLQHWKNQGECQRTLFLSFLKSYHGDTVGAMSVSADSLFTDPYKEMLFQVLKVQQGQYSYDSLETFTRPFLEALEKHKNQIAGVIIEPLIQGAGGMVMWPPQALEIIGSSIKKENIPIIFDEVMTGFGRTGKLFAFEHLNFTPDILCLSKGLTGGSLPLSLTITSPHIYNSFLSDDKSKMFFHGHSFTGNPISCAAAVANIELLKKNDLSLKWKAICDLHKERLRFLKSPEKLIDSRICGTVCALEIKDSENLGYKSFLSEKITSEAMSRGVFLRPLGNILYILPPYSITPQQLHKIWDVIDDILSL